MRIIEHQHSPIFCDNCSLLALASLDGAPLCIDCLQEELIKRNDPRLVDKICPLLPSGGRYTDPTERSMASGTRFRHI